VTARARTFSYDVALDREWAARSTLGGIAIPNEEEDGRFAFAEIRVELDVVLEAPPSPDEVAELIMKGERDCFVGASLTAKPDYHWTVNGEELQ